MSSAVSRILKEKALVYDLRIGSKVKKYFIVRVDRPKHMKFKNDFDAGAKMKLADYGEILFSGFGEPNIFIKKELSQKYNMHLVS